MPCTVVSLTGRICTTFMPRALDQLHERLEVAEVARADASRAPQREHGNGDPAPAPRRGEPEVPVARDDARGRAPGPRHAFEGLGSEAGGDVKRRSHRRRAGRTPVVRTARRAGLLCER